MFANPERRTAAEQERKSTSEAFAFAPDVSLLNGRFLTNMESENSGERLIFYATAAHHRQFENTARQVERAPGREVSLWNNGFIR